MEIIAMFPSSETAVGGIWGIWWFGVIGVSVGGVALLKFAVSSIKKKLGRRED